MKTPFRRSFTSLAALALCSVLPSVHAATEPSARGRSSSGNALFPVDAAGPYVERGTWRVQVLAKLGRPDATLRDGTWLYHGREVRGTSVRGTLVLRWRDGRVDQLALATPETIAAWKAESTAPVRDYVARW